MGKRKKAAEEVAEVEVPGPVVEDLAALGLKALDVSIAYIGDKWAGGKKATAAVAVNAVHLDERFWVVSGMSSGPGGRKWDLLPLYLVEEFGEKFPQYLPTKYAPDEANVGRFDYYTGVMVKVGKAVYAIGPNDARRVVAENGQAAANGHPDPDAVLGQSIRSVEGLSSKSAVALIGHGLVNFGDVLDRLMLWRKQDPSRATVPQRDAIFSFLRVIPGISAAECHMVANAIPDVTPTAPPAAKKPDELTPEQQRQARAEIWEASEEVNRQARRVLDAKCKSDDAKKVLKGAEADHLGAVEEMQKTVGKWYGPVAPDLYHQRPEAMAGPGNAEAWREDKIEVLIDLGGLTAGQVVKLGDDPGLRTMGELTDWIKGPPQRQYTDLPGFGEAKANQLEDAIGKWWESHGFGAVKAEDPGDGFDEDDDDQEGEDDADDDDDSD